jgi:hypothetical protein
LQKTSRSKAHFAPAFGGRWWIRTTEAEKQQIYSLPPLATREISHIYFSASRGTHGEADKYVLYLMKTKLSTVFRQKTAKIWTLFLYPLPALAKRGSGRPLKRKQAARPKGGKPARSLFWSWWTGSNPRPADYKSAALPTELHQRVKTAAGGKWSRRQDSNLRHLGPKPSTLPN